MSSSRILFPQFRDEQSDSKYPFADHTTLTANTGIKIDNDMFLDASFFGIGMAARAYISSVVVTTQIVTITIGDVTAAERVSGSYSVFDPPADGVIKFTDAYGRPAGILLAAEDICNLTRFSAWPVGRHSFTLAATEFVATVVIPANEPGVRALTPEPQQLQTGDVWLVGNNGVVLTAESDHVIRVDIVGEPLFRRALCEDAFLFLAKSSLRTINGCGPDEYGNFTITATNKNVTSPAIRVYPDNNVLKIDTIGS